ncbi:MULTISPECIES: hypothetical protein [Psychrobacillus]|uniref:DUF2178 domain-containing protein n=1 Tax=Psychrobacillus faecigallinarum TaxID=2762235 RepID=A0ABR8RC81_9BACI|nr:hypothetical protein [Psychrobacillus faecigallinarum]MBD7945355.1 hypothetical protein [Psychrobacillus faecigallinarum]QGM32236.1 hypothetical protein GI482_18585 [Bacillus sp. N3536]
MTKSYRILLYGIISGCIIVGAFLGVYIAGKEEGIFDWGLFLPMVVGSLGGFIGFFLFAWLRQKKNGKIPDMDERTAVMMKNYFSTVLYFVLFGSGVILLILFAIGVETIETGMLIVYMMILFMLIGIGAFITKRI